LARRPLAIARIRRAEAIARQAGAKLLPTLDANANAQETKQSYSSGFPAPRGWNDTGRATLDFSWEIDFWGRNRAAVRAATSELEAARSESVAARAQSAEASAEGDLAATKENIAIT